MKHQYVLVVALVVILAGCGGLTGGNGAPGADVETNDSADVGEIDTGASGQFQIESLTHSFLLDYNESQSGTVRITNTGNSTANETLTVTLRDRVLLNDSVSLEPNQTVERSFNSSHIRFSEGEYNIEARIADVNTTQAFTLDHPSPYGKTNVSLFVNDTRVERNTSGIIRNSTSFWEEHAPFPIKYTLVENRSNADLTLGFRHVTKCGNKVNAEFIGCAYLPDGGIGQGPVEAVTQYNLSNPDLQYRTTHQLGHMIGLRHSDPPDYVMNVSLISLSQNTTKVAFRGSDGGRLDAQKKQEAVEALNNLSRRDVDARYGFRWREVSSPEEAHLVITSNSSLCGPAARANSTARNTTVRSVTTDGTSCTADPYYESQLTVVLDDLDTNVVSWHVAHQLLPITFNETPPGLESEADQDEREQWPN